MMIRLRQLSAPIVFATVIVFVLALTLLATAATAADAPKSTATSAPAAAASTPAKGKEATKATSFEDQPLSSKVTKPTAKSAPSKKSSGGSMAILRTIFGLVLVLGTIYGIHSLLKKYGNSKKGVLARGASDAIEVLATTPLTPTRALHLVRVGPEILLIGATDSGVTRLGEIDAQHLALTAAANGDAEFHQALTGAISGQPTHTSMSSGSTTGDNDTFMKRFVANLQMMTAR
ncbi:MAG: flagellar biosynthetic protein FliO [Thermoleophilia bacterium]|nr:flagellar biosynthetic protein FliO [Thermoleophilia bacterium]